VLHSRMAAYAKLQPSVRTAFATCDESTAKDIPTSRCAAATRPRCRARCEMVPRRCGRYGTCICRCR
jgi:hypothetical protein